MGWLYQNNMLEHQTPAEYVAQHFTNETPARKTTVLATATVGGAIFAAVRNEINATGETYVFAAVILYRNNRRDGFGYKDMEETMGPAEADCPDRIMKLLSPVENIPSPGYAAEWRARVAAAKERRAAMRKASGQLVPGAIVRLPHPVTFCKGAFEADAFTFIQHRKRTAVFAPLSRPGFLCRLSRSALADAVIEPPARAASSASHEAGHGPARLVHIAYPRRRRSGNPHSTHPLHGRPRNRSS